MYKTLQTNKKGGAALLFCLCAIALLLASCATGGGKPRAAANLLSNGDFETGNYNGWNVSLSGNAEYAVKKDSYDSNATNYLWLSNYNSGADMAIAVTQTLALSPGEYIASVDVAGDNEGSSPSELVFSATADGAELASTAVALDGWSKWKTYTISFTLEAEATVTLGVTGTFADKSYCDIDDMALYLPSANVASNDGTAIPAEINVTKVEGLSEDFIMGVDISSIVSQLASGVAYSDFDGNSLDTVGKFCAFLKECGVNVVRVRVWNNPYNSKTGASYGGGNNDVSCAVEIAKGCAEAGMDLLVDFRYSDFWTDPAKQFSPKAWASMNVDQKASALAEFTTASLTEIAATGANIVMVQVGNETNNGMSGVTSERDMCKLFSAGAAAVRAFDKNIKIINHVTNPEKGNLVSRAKLLAQYKVDYDILATSYYPYWHGTLDNLRRQIKAVHSTYGKEIIAVETSYPFTYEDTDGHGNSVSEKDNPNLDYIVSVQGQANYLRDLIATVSDAGGSGVLYWEPAWITVGNTHGLTGQALASQVNSNNEKWEKYGSGWASASSGEYDSDAAEWHGGSSWDNQAMFDTSGNPLPSINIWRLVRTGAVSSSTYVEKIEAPTQTIDASGAFTLPDTVTVIYNSGDVKERVTWNRKEADAIDTSVAGSSTVSGKVTFSKKINSGEYEGESTAAVTYTLVVKEPNLVGDDWSFENGGGNFSGLGTNGTDITNEDPYDGRRSLHWWQKTGATSTIAYLGRGGAGIALQPGTYTFECMAQGFAGDKVSLGVADHRTGSTLKAGNAVAMTGWANWQTPTVTLTVTEPATVDLQITIVFQDGGWGSIDCLYLYQSGK